MQLFAQSVCQMGRSRLSILVYHLWNNSVEYTGFRRSFPVRNIIGTQIHFSTVTKLWIEIKDGLNDTKHEHRCTSSVTGHPIFQLACDGIPEWGVSWRMAWSWWSSELATVVTGPHSHSYVKNMGQEQKVNTREELHHWIFNAKRCMNDTDVLCKVQIILNLKYPQLRNCWELGLCSNDIFDWE
jgi:hypothetical protein